MPSTVTSPNMSIVVPVVGVELGPAWATDLYNALYATIDAHDHSSGKGKQVPTAGLNINADLSFGSYNATGLRTTRFSAQSATLTSGTDANCLYSVLGDAYWNDAGGHQIRLTQSGNPVSGPWVAPLRPGNAGGTILSTDTYTLYYVDVSSSPQSFNLPASSLVAAGRTYLFVDIKKNAGTNSITLVPNGTDKINGANASYSITANGAEALFTTDGTGNWYAVTIGGAAGLTAPVTETLRTNSASATYAIDSTGGGSDYVIWHAKSGNVSYVLPALTAGRRWALKDTTGAIGSSANYVSLVPHGSEQINGSSGFSMSGTAYHFTNGSATVTATSSAFTKELYVGCSIQSSNQAGVNYIVSAIGGDSALTLASNFSGTTTTTATATRTSLLFAAPFGTLFIETDGTNVQAKGDGTVTTIPFLASGTFIGPAGSSAGWLRGAGAGGGGGGGCGGQSSASLTNNPGGGGGGAALEDFLDISWTPNTAITVTIGAGGAGGAGGAAASKGTPGNAGGNTTFGSTATFMGASGGGALSGTGVSLGTASMSAMGGASYNASALGASTASNIYFTNSFVQGAGSGPSSTVLSGSSLSTNYQGTPTTPVGGVLGNGGDSGETTSTNATALTGSTGNRNQGRGTAAGGAGGAGGGMGSTTTAGGTGGGGGGAGPGGQGGGGGGGGGGTATTSFGTGGAGGAGGNAGTAGSTSSSSGVGGAGGAGGAAPANSAAGGGGGGAGGNGSTTGGAGASGSAGGSGYLYVSYVL